jgi:hypothetical protein
VAAHHAQPVNNWQANNQATKLGYQTCVFLAATLVRPEFEGMARRKAQSL